MKDVIMTFLAVLLGLALVASIAIFAMIIMLDRARRAEPPVAPMPKPVSIQPDPVIYEHDVKG